MSRVMVAVLAMAALGCRYRAEVVPIWGDPGGLLSLAGEWTGDYSSADSHRRGTIIFSITARGDSAFGEVLMVSDAEDVSPRPADLLESHSRHATSAEILNIQFVRVADGRIRGELESYIAPDCECPVTAVSTGTVDADAVSGVYRTTTDWGGRQGGIWRAVRTRRAGPAD